MDIKKYVRDIPDFPKKGIIFKDITPILKTPDAFIEVIDGLAALLEPSQIEAVAAIESRGFIFGAPLALRFKVPFIPIRKAGKLPAQTLSLEYDLEYGTEKIEIHKDALQQGQRVLLIDDLLATGGTAEAACQLIEKMGAQVEKILFVIELAFLKGRDKLPGRNISTLLHY